jgi:glutaredoxin
MAGTLMLAIVLVGLSVPSAAQQTNAETVRAYVFWQEGCPYCARAITALEAIVATDPSIELTRIELGKDPRHDTAFVRSIEAYELSRAAVPLVAIGGQAFVGYTSGGHSDALYRQAIDTCRTEACPDVVGPLLTRMPAPDADIAAPPNVQALPETLELPFLGEVRTRDLSLPVLTIVLAGIDGFNPCAMWVLVFLIGLLLGLKDERRMWTLGIAFLLGTAVVYFAFLAAWLNLVLILGAIIWVRAVIGIFAVGVGLYFLREYWTNPDPTCRVTGSGQRQRIMAAFRSVVTQNSLAISVLGIVALAFAVNLIELLCSAGLPAVYTQVLALSRLPEWGYYAYLGLYVLVFLIDDVAIFAAAMIAARVTGLTGAYTRASHLIGGLVLLVIGAILILRPEWLSFGMA